MEHKLSCAIVKDLLPNYIEKLTSNETNQEIEEHLQACNPCNQIYKEMTQEVSHEATQDSLIDDAKELSRFLNKTKAVAVIKTSILIMMILGIVVNMIVDVAINHRLTWSIVVIASIVVAICTYVLVIWGGKNKILKGTACASALLLPLLWIISLYCESAGFGGSWFKAVAVPVSCIWLVIVWVAISMYKIFKCNFWVATGILMILAVPGNIWTNAIANGISFTAQLSTLDTIINTAAYILSAIVIFAIGYVRRGKRI